MAISRPMYSLHVHLDGVTYSRGMDSQSTRGWLFLGTERNMVISGTEAELRALADAVLELADEVGHWKRRSEGAA